ncbi:MAG: hypothetical protein HY678_03745 [Chloroflexi bacterium]|nr:hypothetical protein [Chloroflexota bacterium]
MPDSVAYFATAVLVGLLAAPHLKSGLDGVWAYIEVRRTTAAERMRSLR